MSPSAERHLQRNPYARPSTLRQLEKQDEVTARLRAEIDARKRGPTALMLIAGRLKVLALRAKELVQ